VAMNTLYKSFYTDLASLHYVTFIKPFVVSPKEVLSFDFEQFTSTSINKLIQAKYKDHFLFFEEHSFRSVLLYTKSYDVHSEDLSNRDPEYFSEP
jgi:hypothetical protein